MIDPMNDYGRDRLWLLGTAVAFVAALCSSLLVAAPWDELARLIVAPLLGMAVIGFGLSRSRRLVALKPAEEHQAR